MKTEKPGLEAWCDDLQQSQKSKMRISTTVKIDVVRAE
jgi:hypothetical protein